MIVLKREIRHIETLHFLISHKMTGTPDQLAEKLSTKVSHPLKH